MSPLHLCSLCICFEVNSTLFISFHAAFQPRMMRYHILLSQRVVCRLVLRRLCDETAQRYRMRHFFFELLLRPAFSPRSSYVFAIIYSAHFVRIISRRRQDYGGSVQAHRISNHNTPTHFYIFRNTLLGNRRRGYQTKRKTSKIISHCDASPICRVSWMESKEFKQREQRDP